MKPSVQEDPARLYAVAVRRHEEGALDAAEAAYRGILARDPDHADAALRLGTLLRATRRAAEALPLIERALRRSPGRADWQNERGVTLLALHRFGEAERALRASIESDPGFADSRANLASLDLSRGRYVAAEAGFREALAVSPNCPALTTNLGKALFALGRTGEAIDCWRRALDLNPGLASAWRHLGDAYRAEGAFEAAHHALGAALRVSPDEAAGVRWRRAMTWLSAGDLERGWEAHESRPAARPENRPHVALPVWRDEPLQDKRILVHGEQGIGDEIMFASCIPSLEAAARHVVLNCEPRLAPLFARSFPTVEVCGGRREADPPPDLSSRADLWILAGSLPQRFRREEVAFAGGQPFLRAAPRRVAQWRARFAALGAGLKVGVSWRGGRGALVSHRRAVPLALLGSVLKRAGVVPINLQYGECRPDLAGFEAEHGLVVHDWPDGDPLIDLDDYAAKVAALDLVISADNTAVHLAGALGRETWALLPKPADWRWMSGRSDSPWYGSLRLFRQSQPGDWAPVLGAVGDALSARRRQPASPQLTSAARPEPVSQPATASNPKDPLALVLNDTSEWYHWGCTCTSRAIHAALRAKGYAVDLLPVNATHHRDGMPDTIAQFRAPDFFSRYAAANHDLIARLAAADVVVVNGEGTLHGTAPSVRALLYLAYAARTHLGKPVHIINHSCFPEGKAQAVHPPTRALYQLVYGAADFVAVREPISQALLGDLGIDATLAFDCLPLFVETEYRPQERPRAGVVLAGSVAWTKESLPALGRFIAAMALRGEPVSVLVGAKAHPAQDDERFVRTLRASVPEGWTLVDAGSAQAWLDAIGQAKLLVSGRFHHTIAALTLGTPFVVLNSNTPKIDGLIAMTGHAPPLAYAAPDLADLLIARAADALSGEQAPLDETALERLRVRARKNFDGLAQAGADGMGRPGRAANAG